MSEQYSVPTPGALPGIDEDGNVAPLGNEPQVPVEPQVPQILGDPGPPPGDFKSWNEVALSLENLRAHMDSKAPVVPVDPKAPQVPQVPQAGEIQELTQEHMGALFNEWTANGGSLTAQTYERLRTQHGVSQGTVEQFVQGQQAQAQMEAQAMYNAVGGQQQFEQMAQWAKRELPPQDFQAFNRLIANANSTGDVGIIQMAVQSLAQKWQSAEGFKQGRGLAPTQAAPMQSMGGQPFMSMEQLVVAQSDPKYARDPAYRAEVEQRVLLSHRAGTI